MRGALRSGVCNACAACVRVCRDLHAHTGAGAGGICVDTQVLASGLCVWAPHAEYVGSHVVHACLGQLSSLTSSLWRRLLLAHKVISSILGASAEVAALTAALGWATVGTVGGRGCSACPRVSSAVPLGRPSVPGVALSSLCTWLDTEEPGDWWWHCKQDGHQS